MSNNSTFRIRTLIFFKKSNGESPAVEFLNSLESKSKLKIYSVFQKMETMPFVAQSFYKKLKDSDNIWEIRIEYSSNIYRFLCFQDAKSLIVLTNGFQKKAKKHHTVKLSWQKNIRQTTCPALKRGEFIMHTLDDLINDEEKKHPGFKTDLKAIEEETTLEMLGALIRERRKKMGITQQDLADRIGTKKSAISRIERSAKDMRMSTFFSISKALGSDIMHVLVSFSSVPKQLPKLKLKKANK